MKSLGGFQVNEVPDILENLDPSILHSWRKFLRTVGDVAHPVPILRLGKRPARCGSVASSHKKQNKLLNQRQSCTTGCPHIA
jgi:hypothetical protein